LLAFSEYGSSCFGDFDFSARYCGSPATKKLYFSAADKPEITCRIAKTI
jgi:hypothetical protein